MRRAALAAVAGLIALSGLAQAAVPRYPTKPSSGGPHTTFSLRYKWFGPDAENQLYLRGPRGTRCAGLIVQEAVGWASGPQTLNFQFKREGDTIDGPAWFRPRRSLRRDPPDGPSGPPLRSWCPGYYHGYITNIGNRSGEFLEARFFFVVN
jgi:hypothetical protein